MAAQAAGGPAQTTPAASGATTTAAQGAQAQGKIYKIIYDNLFIILLMGPRQ